MTDTPNITAIFAGIQTRLAIIAGLRAYSEMPGTVNPPCAWPDLSSLAVGYDLDMGGSIVLTVKVRLALPSGGPGLVRAQAALMPYLAASGASSIKGAIEGDLTLGGTVQTVHVSSASGIEDWEYGQTACLVCDWTVTVWP